MRLWHRTKPLTCEELVSLVTEYLEGALPRRDRRRFEEHLKGCLDCPEYVKQIRAVVAAAGRPGPTAPPLPDDAALVTEFRAWRDR